MRRILVVLLVTSVLMPRASAHSDYKAPPRGFFLSGRAREELRQGSYCWSWQGMGECAEYIGGFGRAQGTTKAGRKARIRYRFHHRPALLLTYYRHVDMNGYGQGRRRHLPVRIHGHRVRGKSVWDAIFTTPSFEGHFYLEVESEWEYGPKGNYGGHGWSYLHLKLR